MRSVAAASLGIVLLGAPVPAGDLESTSRDRTAPRATPAEYRGLALDLEENLGQADPAARFVARGRGFLAFLTDGGAVFACAPGPGPSKERAFAGGDAAAPLDLVRLRFPGADAGSPHEARTRRPGLTHFLRGRDPARRVVGARRFGEVRRRDLWPGVDLLWRGGAGRSLEYAFEIRPGADASRIALAFDGASARLDPSGDLLLATSRGVLRHGRPTAYQPAGDGGRIGVAAGFELRDDGSVGFRLGLADPRLALVVDPQVVFSEAHGGSGEDEAWAVASDPEGGVYFAGWSISADLPLQGPYDGTLGGEYDAFVAKRGPRGTGLLYATYLGGEDDDLAYGLAVTPSGSAIAVGGTASTDFPVLGAFQTETGTPDLTGFVTRLAPDGASLLGSTYLGGTLRDEVRAVVLGADGAIHLAGTTVSPDFPTVNAVQPGYGGSIDAFVARMSADGASLDWSTYLGGSLIDEGRGLGLGVDGAVFVAGATESIDFPDVAALQTTLSGSRDAFVAALDPDGAAVRWATYLGGNGLEEGWGLAVDASGSPWVCGFTTSDNFPLQDPVDPLTGGEFEGFATRFAADGTSRLVSTYLGGKGDDKAEAVAADTAGVVYVVGRTGSTDFPRQAAVDGTLSGDLDAFITALSNGGKFLLWSTYRGGGGTDYAMAATVDKFGAVLFAGRTTGEPADGLVSGIIAVPLPPATCTATLTGQARVRLEWSGESTTEDGYVVERRIGDGPWVEVKTTAPNVGKLVDPFLLYSTTYYYRVYAFNEYGRSAPSPVATVTTRPYPAGVPTTPGDFRILYFDGGVVDFAWNDLSEDEDSFVIDRWDRFYGFVPLGFIDMDGTDWRDFDVLPMRPYRYRARAVNARGTSPATPEVEVLLPPSFTMEIVKARRKDKAAEGKDSLMLEGVITGGPGLSWLNRPPYEFPLEIHLGADAQALANLPVGFEAWVRKKNGWTLKYPHYPRGNLLIVIDPGTSTWKLTLKGANLPPIGEGPELVRFLAGDDGSSFAIPWVPLKKAGTHKYP